MRKLVEFNGEFLSVTKGHPQKYIVFCDPGGDDAMMLAQMLAIHNDKILAIVASAGNTSTRNTVRNTLSICELAGITNIKVFAGSEKPIFSKGKPITSAEHVYSPDLGLPSASLKPASGDWLDFCANAINSSIDPITIISTGSLTDVALLLEKLSSPKSFPISNPWSSSTLNKISCISIMGGAIDIVHHANAPDDAEKCWGEFNILFDPNASSCVFSLCKLYKIAIFLATTDLTHTTLCGAEEADTLSGMTNNPLALTIARLMGNVPKCYKERYGDKAKQPVHDINSSMCVLHPELYQGEWISIDVIPYGQINAGQTIMKTHSSNTVFLLSLPRKRQQNFFACFYEDLSHLPSPSPVEASAI